MTTRIPVYCGGVNDELRAELLRRGEKDQVARRADDVSATLAADAENLPWLRQVIAEYGWPGKALVGEDGADAAWLLAQHADRDLGFQRRCLDLLTTAVTAGEAKRQHLAYLTDRVLLAEGQQQVYGTQMTASRGRWVPKNLRDPDTVDERRAPVDLGPLAEYLDDANKNFGPPGRTTFSCPGCGSPIEFDLPEDNEPMPVTCGSCGSATTVQVRPAGSSGAAQSP
jgi:hypothetical protein